MVKDKILIGRKREQQKFNTIVKSKKSEFVALYGRRRVGKTFLIMEFFHYTFSFYLTGLANATNSQQLFILIQPWKSNLN